MKNLEKFNKEELVSLEMLEIKGGRTMMVQDSINLAAVCTGHINCNSQNNCTDTNCTNSGNCVAGCGCSPK